MNDEQLLRYSRQIMLPQVGIEGQQKINDAHVLIIGLGGLGSPVAMYLAAAGIGQLTLVDHDRVDLTNLQRQILHTTEDVNSPKTRSAKASILALNPQVQVTCIDQQLHDAELDTQIQLADIVVDATDNFRSRFEINRSCYQNNTPLVSAAAIRFEGHLTVFDFRQQQGPCYQCLYPQQDTEQNSQETCSETGILGPVVGAMGCLQALEVLKLICEIGDNLKGQLLIFDALTMDWRKMNYRRDASCPVCGSA